MMPTKPDDGGPVRPRFHYGFTVLALVVAAVFGSLGLARFGYAVILPSMQEELGLTNTQTGGLQSWNLLGYLAAVVFSGVLATRFGPRAVVSVSLVLTGAAMVWTGLAATFHGVCAGRFLAGVGGAGGNVPAIALLSSWFGAKRRGLASGIGVAGSSVGLMVTGLLVPALLERYGAGGWRVCWMVLGGITFTVFVLCALFLRNRPSEMGLAPVGETEEETRRRTVGADGDGTKWTALWRSRVLWHLAVIYLAFGFSYIIYSTFFIRHLVKEGGFTRDAAGLLWSQIGMVSAASGFIWGAVSDRWGRRTALLGVFALQGTSFLVFGISAETEAVYVSAGLFALTAWSIPALMAALCGDVFGPRLAPAALGLLTISFGIGQVLGPYAAGRMADASQSFSGAFVAAGLAAWVLGGGGTVLLRSPARR